MVQTLIFSLILIRLKTNHKTVNDEKLHINQITLQECHFLNLKQFKALLFLAVGKL